MFGYSTFCTLRFCTSSPVRKIDDDDTSAYGPTVMSMSKTSGSGVAEYSGGVGVVVRPFPTRDDLVARMGNAPCCARRSSSDVSKTAIGYIRFYHKI